MKDGTVSPYFPHAKWWPDGGCEGVALSHVPSLCQREDGLFSGQWSNFPQLWNI